MAANNYSYKTKRNGEKQITIEMHSRSKENKVLSFHLQEVKHEQVSSLNTHKYGEKTGQTSTKEPFSLSKYA